MKELAVEGVTNNNLLTCAYMNTIHFIQLIFSVQFQKCLKFQRF